MEPAAPTRRLNEAARHRVETTNSIQHPRGKRALNRRERTETCLRTSRTSSSCGATTSAGSTSAPTTMGIMGYRTPNIDRIGREGAVFTDWYGAELLHRRPAGLHHRPIADPHRPDQGRPARLRSRSPTRGSRRSPSCSSRSATPPASSARTTSATATSSCRPRTASTSSSATSTTSTPKRSRKTRSIPRILPLPRSSARAA